MSREMDFDPYSDMPFRDPALRAEDGSSDSPPPDSPSTIDDNYHRHHTARVEHARRRLPAALPRTSGWLLHRSLCCCSNSPSAECPLR
ncbi:hypothetical protein MTO96_017842 [Rhipicephalus appendiculatus]